MFIEIDFHVQWATRLIWQWDIQDIKIHLKKQQKDWKEYETCYPKFHGSGGKLSLLKELLASF